MRVDQITEEAGIIMQNTHSSFFFNQQQVEQVKR